MTFNAFSIETLDMGQRILLVLAIAVAAHLSVLSIRHLTQKMLSADAMLRWTKLRTLAGLLASMTIFTLYFGGVGLVLHEFGI